MIIVDQSKCVGCGMCIRDCLFSNLHLVDGKAAAGQQRCNLCGHCVAVCPRNAVTIEGMDKAEIKEYNMETMTMAPRHLADFMQWRRSIRQFQARAVDHLLIEQILQVGRYSPTGSNSQQVRYVVLEQTLSEARSMAAETLLEQSRLPANQLYRPILQKIYEAQQEGRDLLFYDAPVVIVILDRQSNGLNGALAASRMELMANALGLGACFVGFFITALKHNPALREKIQMAEDCTAVTSLAIGYPAVRYCRTVPRKPVQAMWL